MYNSDKSELLRLGFVFNNKINGKCRSGISNENTKIGSKYFDRDKILVITKFQFLSEYI